MTVYELILDASPQGIYGSKAALGDFLVDYLLKTNDKRLYDLISIYERQVK